MKKLFFTTLFALLLLGGTSCKKYLDVNENPNNPNDVTVDVLLSSSELHLAYGIGGDISRYTSMWMQQAAAGGNQFLGIENYTVLAGDFDNVWRFNLYGGPLNDLHILNQKATDKGYKSYAGIAKVLMAYGMSIVTDCWGDVPFREAFLGEANQEPVYDSQQQLYGDIITMIDSALADFAAADPGAVVPGGNDFIYGGDISLWTKAANVLKARLYLHMGGVDNTKYALALSTLAGGFADHTEDFLVTFASTQTGASPWYQFDRDRPGDVEIRGFMIDTMTGMGDPRLAVYENGALGIGSYYGTETSPVVFLSYAEQKFIEAECKFRGNDKPGAATAFNEAVQASLDQMGVSDATFTSTYGSETGATITLEKIMLQKYVALFTQPEVWADWRRTDLPALTPSPDNTTGGFIPRRFYYPLTEQQYNPNCPANTVLTAPVWWDN